jgi:hypothetical protein
MVDPFDSQMDDWKEPDLGFAFWWQKISADCLFVCKQQYFVNYAFSRISSAQDGPFCRRNITVRFEGFVNSQSALWYFI